MVKVKKNAHESYQAEKYSKALKTEQVTPS